MRTQVFSSGGGTQSACIAAMICNGDLPKPDYAVIADTGFELSGTWDYLDNVVNPALSEVGVEVIRVRSREYRAQGLWGGRSGKDILIPAFTTQSGEVGKLPTYCSTEWKSRVIDRWCSEQGINELDYWIGFSIDEKHRIKLPTGKRQKRYPLIEKRFTRNDSIQYVKRMGWPDPPRSACFMCPNKTAHEWKWMKEQSPQDFEKAIRFEERIRLADEDVWLTQNAVPLKEIEFDDEQQDLFGTCTSGNCFT